MTNMREWGKQKWIWQYVYNPICNKLSVKSLSSSYTSKCNLHSKLTVNPLSFIITPFFCCDTRDRILGCKFRISNIPTPGSVHLFQPLEVASISCHSTPVVLHNSVFPILVGVWLPLVRSGRWFCIRCWGVVFPYGCRSFIPLQDLPLTILIPIPDPTRSHES